MKTKKRKLNVRLLRRIQKHILAEPRRFFMAWFVAKIRNGIWGADWHLDYDLASKAPPCGTAACIAGWANLLTGATEKTVDSPARAASKLGLSKRNEDYLYLFHFRAWPHPFSTKYAAAKTPHQRVKIACARIDHLIKTGE